MASNEQVKIGRRALLAAGAGGAAVAAAHALAAPATVLGAQGGPAVIGDLNEGTDRTGFTSTTNDGVTGASQVAAKSGVYGTNSNAGGYGVFGRNLALGTTGYLGGPGDAVSGDSGVAGKSGVYGHSNNSAGYGVAGRNNTGLVGWLAGAGVAVHAEAPAGQTALEVVGRASFNRSGVAVVPATKRTVKVTGIPLAASSFVLATIQQDRAGVYVEAAVPSVGGSSITIYLNRVMTSATRVAWMVIG